MADRIDVQAITQRYRRARTLLRACRTHFSRFCQSADRLNGEGFAVSTEDGVLRLRFLDRDVRVSLRLVDRSQKCVLHVEDYSKPGSAPRTITRIPIADTGETPYPDGCTGDNVTLGLEQDHITLAMQIVGVSMVFDPWAD